MALELELAGLKMECDMLKKPRPTLQTCAGEISARKGTQRVNCGEED